MDNGDPDYVVFEHVWAEALVNFTNYRGASGTIQTCATAGEECQWVPLDPSFKLRTYEPEHRDLLENLSFDYNAYYNAEGGQELRDKSPLEIFEENALAFLRNNHPGLTLEDVIDQGEVIEERLGVLPSSLPYEVVGPVERFTSVQDHDANSPSGEHDWNKNVTVTAYPIIGGAERTGIPLGGTFSAADLSTKRLTVNWGLVDGQTEFAIRLDGVKEGSSITGNLTISCNGVTETITEASRFNLLLEVDASSFIDPVEVPYDNLIVGGYYLIATGGETSNWSQVRRAYRSLLAANEDYPLINNSTGEVYVDIDGDDAIGANDVPLLDHQEAQDALTGGFSTRPRRYITRD